MIFASAVIRKAVPSDINQITPLLKELFSIEEDFTFNESAQWQGLLMMLHGNEKRCIMFAEPKDQIIGMCSAQLLVSTAEGWVVALIENMVVAKSYQKQGIGKRHERN